jgi:hypothetical protein
MEHIRSLDKIGGKVRGRQHARRHDAPNSSPLDRRLISGTITNDGKTPCAKAGLVIGLYDAAGKLAEIKEGDAATELLEPGASATVKVYILVGFDDAWKEKATFKAWGRCSEPY